MEPRNQDWHSWLVARCGARALVCLPCIYVCLYACMFAWHAVPCIYMCMYICLLLILCYYFMWACGISPSSGWSIAIRRSLSAQQWRLLYHKLCHINSQSVLIVWGVLHSFGVYSHGEMDKYIWSMKYVCICIILCVISVVCILVARFDCSLLLLSFFLPVLSLSLSIHFLPRG